MAPSSVGRGSLAAHSPPLAAVSTSIHVQSPHTAANSPRAAKNRTLPASPGSACVRSFSRSPLDHHLQPLPPPPPSPPPPAPLWPPPSSPPPRPNCGCFLCPFTRLHGTAVDPPAMPKVSKYIENKSNVLFDMHRQLADIKRGKAFREGDTSTVRRRPGARGEGGRKTRSARRRSGLPPLTDAPPLPPPCSAVSKSTYLYSD